MRLLALLIPILFTAMAFAGCTAIQDLVGPRAQVQFTPLETGDDVWNTDDRFRVVAKHSEPVTVRIELSGDDGRDETFTSTDSDTTQEDGVHTTDLAIRIPDGTWTVTYYVDGRQWDSLGPVQVDTTPPAPQEDVASLADAEGDAYTFPALSYEAGAALELVDFDTGTVLATSLPYTARTLPDGVHKFLLRIQDPAGNQYKQTIHVRVGDAVTVDPEDGQYSVGILARYTREVQLWDLTDTDAYLSRADARAEVDATYGREGAYLSSGYGITPAHATVQGVVDDVVTDDMNSMEAARELFIWMYDELEYDDERLVSNTLMLPHQVIEDAEDPDAETGPGGSDEGDDGLADDGPGNGVRGGVCRDLAGTYVSLLRAAGVPARLVSGYLSGNVDGFHAWVEFYAGELDGQEAWVPVDVSGIDGVYSADEDGDGVPDGMSGFLQSFAISLPDYLPLRHVPEADEVAGWSTALSVAFEYSDQPPDLSFEKAVNLTVAEEMVLCINVATMARGPAQTPEECDQDTFGHPDGRYISDFIWTAEQTIDYGVQVHDSGTDATIVAEVAFPDHDNGVQDDEALFVTYSCCDGIAFDPYDAGTTPGKYRAEFEGDQV